MLVVDDDAVFRAAVRRYLEAEGFEVAVAGEADAALATLERESFDLVLTDLRMPGIDGVELVRRIRALDPEAVCIVITGFGSPERSIEALRAGAFWFVDKTYERIGTLGALIEKALELRSLQTSNRQLHRQLELRYGFESIVGESAALQRTLETLRKVADTDASVLLLGESGVGKELFAHALHWNSPRSKRPFVAVNCGAIPEELLESELFGHVKGAFTGASRDRLGRFAVADGGTLFLDEIGDMSPRLQIKLLRVLQELEFEPVGSSETRRVDVRIVSATNQNLPEMILQRRFRDDLYFRLAVVPLEIPPLRERRDDVPLLVEHFFRELRRAHPGIEGVTELAMKRLAEYEWPGNVRELRSMLERVSVIKRQGWIDELDIPAHVRGGERPRARVEVGPAGVDCAALVDAFETDLLRQALDATGWNKNRAAQLLNMKRTTLVEKVRAKGLLQE